MTDTYATAGDAAAWSAPPSPVDEFDAADLPGEWAHKYAPGLSHWWVCGCVEIGSPAGPWQWRIYIARELVAEGATLERALAHPVLAKRIERSRDVVRGFGTAS